MTNALNMSIIRSVFFTGLASVLSYLLIILVVRIYSKEDVSYYLYVVAWGLLLTLILDLAAEQSLVHYSKSKNIDIFRLWKKLCAYKAIFLFAALILSSLWEAYSGNEIPQMVAFMMIPAFYMGPVFEYHGLNTKYARILFIEKFIFFILTVILSQIIKDIKLVIYAYFLISCLTLCTQVFVTRPFIGHKTPSVKINIFQYACLYLPVYLIIISQLVYGNISRLIIDAKMGAIAFAAITLSLQVVNAISIVQSQVDRHIRPAIIQAIGIHDRNALAVIIKHYLLFYLCPVALGCILMSSFSSAVITILFGPNWTEAGDALRYASPLIFTISCMRLIDILVVPLHAARMNLFVNVTSGALLFGLLWFNPSSSLESYVLLIVVCQATHVAFMSTYVYARAKRAMAFVAATDNAPGISG